MLTYFNITNCVGVSDNGDGTYRVDMADGSSRLATSQEIFEAKKASFIAEINAEASRRIIASYPLEKQSSANLGIYPQTYTDKMIAYIAAVIQASNDACDAVLAAVDIAVVEAVTVNWPVIGA